MSPQENIAQVIRLLAPAVPPGTTICLFGSQAKGSARDDSDIDLLIIEPEVAGGKKEMSRLANILRPTRLPVDIIVYSRKTYNDWVDVPGTMIHDAAREGKVIYEKP